MVSNSAEVACFVCLAHATEKKTASDLLMKSRPVGPGDVFLLCSASRYDVWCLQKWFFVLSWSFEHLLPFCHLQPVRPFFSVIPNKLYSTHFLLTRYSAIQEVVEFKV